jgi:hypothetical protein
MQGDSSFLSSSLANASPMPSTRHMLTRHRHSSVNHTGELMMSPRESGYNRVEAHANGAMYAQPTASLGHRHSTPGGLQLPAATPQYQQARSPHTHQYVPPLSLSGMQPRQSSDSLQGFTNHWHRPAEFAVKVHGGLSAATAALRSTLQGLGMHNGACGCPAKQMIATGTPCT